MNKYFVIFRVPVATMDEWRASTDPAKIKEMSDKMMADMSAWMERHAGSFVERGAPLGRTKSVSSNGIADARNDLNYYMIVQADSHQSAAQLFVDCPHLQIPTSTVDVMEIPHMGM